MKQDNSSGYAALRRGAGLLDHSGTGRILLTGADRRSYLQGLLTNDIEALGPGTGCYAAMLTAQGRMISDMRVLELGGGVLLDLPAEVTASVAEHLDRFVFSEDVQVEDVTAARLEIGLYGPRAAGVLAAAGIKETLPDVLFGSTRIRIDDADAVLVRGDRIGIAGYDLIIDAGVKSAIGTALLQAGAVDASDADAETVRVESGRPRFGADMTADTIPLEAGLEDRAISRSKGCYVGQEVIVRVQDRGHGRVAKRLVGLAFDPSAAVPTAGARIASDDREIGRVTSAVWSVGLGRAVALGYVQRDFVEPGTAVLVDGVGAVVSDVPFIA